MDFMDPYPLGTAIPHATALGNLTMDTDSVWRIFGEDTLMAYCIRTWRFRLSDRTFNNRIAKAYHLASRIHSHPGFSNGDVEEEEVLPQYPFTKLYFCTSILNLTQVVFDIH